MSGSETEFIDDTQTQQAPTVDTEAIKEQAKQEIRQELAQSLNGGQAADPNAAVFKQLIDSPAQFQQDTASQAARMAAFQASVEQAVEWLDETYPDLDPVEAEVVQTAAGVLMKNSQGKLSPKAAMKKAAEKYLDKTASVTDNTRVLDLGSSPKPKAKETNLMAMSPEEFEAWEAQNGLR